MGYSKRKKCRCSCFYCKKCVYGKKKSRKSRKRIQDEPFEYIHLDDSEIVYPGQKKPRTEKPFEYIHLDDSEIVYPGQKKRKKKRSRSDEPFEYIHLDDSELVLPGQGTANLEPPSIAPAPPITLNRRISDRTGLEPPHTAITNTANLEPPSAGPRPSRKRITPTLVSTTLQMPHTVSNGISNLEPPPIPVRSEGRLVIPSTTLPGLEPPADYDTNPFQRAYFDDIDRVVHFSNPLVELQGLSEEQQEALDRRLYFADLGGEFIEENYPSSAEDPALTLLLDKWVRKVLKKKLKDSAALRLLDKMMTHKKYSRG